MSKQDTHFFNTFSLVIGILVAVAIGIPLGIISALRRNTLTDYTAMGLAVFGVSVPVIILAPEGENPDSEVIKTILALTNNPDRRPDPYHIVAELQDLRNVEVARMVGRDEAQLIVSNDLISRIIVQTSRYWYPLILSDIRNPSPPAPTTPRIVALRTLVSNRSSPLLTTCGMTWGMTPIVSVCAGPAPVLATPSTGRVQWVHPIDG